MYPVFENGSCWVKVDFHLHTRADKEFRYAGESDRYIRDYVNALKAAEVSVGVITNHNKFDPGEFKVLRKAARREGMDLLPGVELSVNDGQAGVHTLVVFADEKVSLRPRLRALIILRMKMPVQQKISHRPSSALTGMKGITSLYLLTWRPKTGYGAG